LDEIEMHRVVKLVTTRMIKTFIENQSSVIIENKEYYQRREKNLM